MSIYVHDRSDEPVFAGFNVEICQFLDLRTHPDTVPCRKFVAMTPEALRVRSNSVPENVLRHLSSTFRVLWSTYGGAIVQLHWHALSLSKTDCSFG